MRHAKPVFQPAARLSGASIYRDCVAGPARKGFIQVTENRRAHTIALLLRSGAWFSDTEPARVDYVRNIYVTDGGFEGHERWHRDRFVTMLVPKLGLPPELVRIIVMYWAHVGFYFPPDAPIFQILTASDDEIPPPRV